MFDQLRVCLRFYLKKDSTLGKNVAITDLIQSPNNDDKETETQKEEVPYPRSGELGLGLRCPEPSACTRPQGLREPWLSASCLT